MSFCAGRRRRGAPQSARGAAEGVAAGEAPWLAGAARRATSRHRLRARSPCVPACGGGRRASGAPLRAGACTRSRRAFPPPPRLVAQRRAWGEGDGPTPPQRRAPDRRGARRGQHRRETARYRARGRSRARDSSAPKTGRCTRLLHLTANAGGQGSGRALRRGVRQCRQSVRCQRTVQPSRGSRMPDGVLATV